MDHIKEKEHKVYFWLLTSFDWRSDFTGLHLMNFNGLSALFEMLTFQMNTKLTDFRKLLLNKKLYVLNVKENN